MLGCDSNAPTLSCACFCECNSHQPRTKMGKRCAAASFRSRHTARRGYAGREQFPLLLQFFDPTSSSAMCDFSLHNVKSRPAKVGDKLTTHNFSTGTCGFAAPEDSTTAVCILPGTELAFSAEVICASSRLFGWRTISSRTAIL